MNKENYTTMLNILQSKDSSREGSSKKDGSREMQGTRGRRFEPPVQ